MQKRILDKWLNQHRWNHDVVDAFRLNRKFEIIFETQFFQRKIEFEQFYFLAEFYKIFVRIMQSATNKIGELRDECVRVIYITFQHKILDGIERVENKMRIHLRLNGSKTRCVKFVFQFGFLFLEQQTIAINERNHRQYNKS